MNSSKRHGKFSLKAFCRERNLNYPLVKLRMKQGMGLEEAVNSAFDKRKEYFHEDQRVSLVELCFIRQIKYATVYGRLKRGLSLENALKPEVEVVRPKRVKKVKPVDNETLQKRLERLKKRAHKEFILQECRRLGLCHTTVLARIKMGLTVEQALSIPKRSRYISDPKEVEMRMACKENGVLYASVKNKMRKKGLSLQEAIFYYKMLKQSSIPQKNSSNTVHSSVNLLS